MAAIYTVWYNLIKMHKTLRMSAAMAAVVTDGLGSVDDLVAMMDEVAPKPGPRGQYKRKSQLA
ncbi:MAG: hypothetical protein K5872_16305 [Rhizobiaceae bacterium]|nr:hypothetical protein [Rhizobiaceae bacterium]MCV0407784.1 hypothetical protein [Rhizobiaceae bacterium]